MNYYCRCLQGFLLLHNWFVWQKVPNAHHTKAWRAAHYTQQCNYATRDKMYNSETETKEICNPPESKAHMSNHIGLAESSSCSDEQATEGSNHIYSENVKSLCLSLQKQFIYYFAPLLSAQIQTSNTEASYNSNRVQQIERQMRFLPA